MYSSSTTPLRAGDAVNCYPSSSLHDDHEQHNDDTAIRTPNRSVYTPRQLSIATFDILSTPPQRNMLPPRQRQPSVEDDYENNESSTSKTGGSVAHASFRRIHHKSQSHHDTHPQHKNATVVTTPQRHHKQRYQYQQPTAASPYREPHRLPLASTPQHNNQRTNYTNHYSRTPYRSATATPSMLQQEAPRRPRFPPPESVAPIRKDRTSTKPISIKAFEEKEVTHFPVTYNPTQEPIKAYLRIRPRSIIKSTTQSTPNDTTNETDMIKDTEGKQEDSSMKIDGNQSLGPYLKILSQHEILMTPTEDSNAFRNRNSPHPERYKFTDIFNDTVSQYSLFTKTTLPLVHDVLEKGENALLFAYGVTNSGKTFTIMGTREEPGILSRTLGVIFNSIGDSLTSDDIKLKPCMHSGVQSYNDLEEEHRDVITIHQGQNEQAMHSSSADKENHSLSLDTAFLHDEQQENLRVPIDTGYEYSIWVSFAEVYTEKIYDLLVSPPPDETYTAHIGQKRKYASGNNISKRKALALKYETNSKNKYIAGLKQVRVKSIEEAYAVLFQGLSNRAQYSTLLNQTSSRSHSIFTIAIVKIPIDDADQDFVIEDPRYSTVSKFQIVDLAGSERHRNTLNEGQRLKEAGQINKSLMVLGQCMETLRLNQIRAANGKKKDMVPYQHSKLTELFRSSFEGNGKAVMVVNVNPYQTGFDENSHVMKFAAVAKDVATWKRVHPKLNLKGLTQQLNVKKRQRRRPLSASPPVGTTEQAEQQHQQQQQQHHVYHGIDDLMADEDDDIDERDLEESIRNNSAQSNLCQKAQPGYQQEDVLSHLSRNDDEGDEENIVEESDESEDDEGDVEKDPFVDTLIEQLEEMRTKWLEAEARCERMESEIREQVTKETELELKTMEDIYMKSLKQDNELNETMIKQRVRLDTHGIPAIPAADFRRCSTPVLSDKDRKMNDKGNDSSRIKELVDKQEAISSQLNRFMSYMSEHERTRHQLLEKITELEKSKQKQTETIQKLKTRVEEQELVLEAVKIEKNMSSDQNDKNNSEKLDTPDHHWYLKFFDLKKKKLERKASQTEDR